MNTRNMFTRRMLQALVDHPERTWSVAELGMEGDLNREKTTDLLYELTANGSLQAFWDPPSDGAAQHPSGRSRRIRQTRRYRPTPAGLDYIRLLLNESRAKTVAGALLSEGAEAARVVREARRRERAWKRRRRGAQTGGFDPGTGFVTAKFTSLSAWWRFRSGR